MSFESLYPDPFDATAEQLDADIVTAIDTRQEADEDVPDIAITAPEDMGAELDPVLGQRLHAMTPRLLRYPSPLDMGPTVELRQRGQYNPKNWERSAMTETASLGPKANLDQVDPGLISDNRRPNVLTEGQLEIAKRIDESVQEARDILAETSGLTPEDIQQKPGSCMEMSILTGSILQGKEAIDTVIRTSYLYDGTSGRAWHYFLATRGLSEGDLDLDGTWKQMVDLWERDPAYDDKPDVLVVPKSETNAALTSYGVPAKYQSIWTRDTKPMDQDWRVYVTPQLRSALEIVHQRHKR